ncbi:MAG: hypothetical protein ACK5OX_14690 [Desertimonas sp.]
MAVAAAAVFAAAGARGADTGALVLVEVGLDDSRLEPHATRAMTPDTITATRRW